MPADIQSMVANCRETSIIVEVRGGRNDYYVDGTLICIIQNSSISDTASMTSIENEIMYCQRDKQLIWDEVDSQGFQCMCNDLL